MPVLEQAQAKSGNESCISLSQGMDEDSQERLLLSASTFPCLSGERPAVADSDTSRVPPNRITPVRPAGDERLRHLAATNRRLRELQTCRVCRCKTVNTIFLPCGHICTCATCAPSVRDCIRCHSRIHGTAHVCVDDVNTSD